jgi:hypothetical protein
MMLMYYGAMLFDIYVLTDAIDEFPLSVQEDVHGINGPPWTQDLVKEWIVLVWVFHLCTCGI